MRVLKLVSRNAMRRPLRTFLTILGLAIAVMAFTLIRTSIDAWYLQAEAASPNRLVTRNAVSIVFDMPLAYKARIASVDGVTGVSHAGWFGGTYIDQRNFFPQFYVEHDTYFDLYPEFIVPPEQMEAFFAERNAVIVGRKLADRFGWSVGDPIRLTGTIFPGDWDFVIRGIYTGAKETTDESSWFFRYDCVDERMRVEMPPRAGQVGSYIVRIADPSRAAEISEEIDRLFENSLAETLTETEEAYNLSFVSMGSSIIVGLRIISIMVIGIIMLVLGNTMAMTARERVNEYAVMKTLGFRPVHIVGLIGGESLFVGALGGLLGLAIAFPVHWLVKTALSAWFPIFSVATDTLVYGGLASLGVGLLAAVFPTLKALRTRIVEGLRIVD